MYPLSSRTHWNHIPQATVRAAPVDRVAAVIVLATIASGTLWLIAGPVLGLDLEVTTGDATRTVGIGSVLASTVVAAVAGWASLALLGRWTKGRTVWTWGALVLASLSLVSPLTMASSAGAAVTLAAMHVTVAAVVVPGLRLAMGSRR